MVGSWYPENSETRIELDGSISSSALFKLKKFRKLELELFNWMLNVHICLKEILVESKLSRSY